MEIFRKVLVSKIEGASITESNSEIEGTLTIPADLLEAAGISNYEAINVWNLTVGTRFETYAISGARGSSKFVINGSAANLTRPGDKISVACFGFIPSQGVTAHKPRLIFVDNNNHLVNKSPEKPPVQSLSSICLPT